VLAGGLASYRSTSLGGTTLCGDSWCTEPLIIWLVMLPMYSWFVWCHLALYIKLGLGLLFKKVKSHSPGSTLDFVAKFVRGVRLLSDMSLSRHGSLGCGYSRLCVGCCWCPAWVGCCCKSMSWAAPLRFFFPRDGNVLFNFCFVQFAMYKGQLRPSLEQFIELHDLYFVLFISFFRFKLVWSVFHCTQLMPLFFKSQTTLTLVNFLRKNISVYNRESYR
jgi:hypothetical protein